MKNNKGQDVSIIPHSQPSLGTEELRRITAVIQSGYLAQGQSVEAFEKAFAEKINMREAAAVASGTAALHLTLLAMEIGAGAEVIIPSYVCAALLNAVRYVGAIPVLADIDPDTGNLDPRDVKKRINRCTRAIIVPHMFGLAADLNGLAALGVPIIEDCAQAVGATYNGQLVGRIGHAAVFSFYATKVMTTGEGGMVVSNSKKLMGRIRDLRAYDGKPRYRIRYNYKMTDIQAALGLVQLEKLEKFIRRRRQIAQKYRSFMEPCGLQLPPQDPGHIYYRFVVGLTSNSDLLITYLQQKGIMCEKPVYRPLHRLLRQKGFVHTDRAWRRSISIPIYPGLVRRQIEWILKAVVEGLKGVKQ